MSAPTSRDRTWVHTLLRETGADEHRILDAEQRQQLHLLAADVVAIQDPPRYTSADVAELTGLEPQELHQLWVSFGFPTGPDEGLQFTQTDLDAVTNVVGLRALVGIDAASVALARVIGSATSRVAEAGLSSLSASNAGVADADRADRLLATGEMVMPGLARLLDFAARRHFQAAARRTLSAEQVARSDGWVDGTAVGFADLASFTASSQQLTGGALEVLITHFADVVHTVVHGGGGRVVKMIGDEVMFVAATATAGVRIGLDLVEAAATDELLTAMKVGIAYGCVLARDGDYFGPAVNAAARVAGMTRPGAVVVTADVRSAAADAEDLSWRSLRRCYLRGLGWMDLWAVGDDRSLSARPRATSRAIAVVDELARESLERMSTWRGRVG